MHTNTTITHEQRDNACITGCRLKTSLLPLENTLSPPPDPVGPLTLIQTNISGQLSSDFTCSVPRMYSDDRLSHPQPVVFLFKYEDANSHNVSYVWMVSKCFEN